jgi:hypothetical protein
MRPQALAIYDNGGKSWDRYTVIIGHDVYGMSDNAREPGGFNQYAGTVEEFPRTTKHLGKKKLLEELSGQVRHAIAERLDL